MTAPKSRYNKILLDITGRCNLRCPVCYNAGAAAADMSLADLRLLAGNLRGKIISLCGGEPTEREDLPEIIASFSKNNTVFLVTNGLKLADRRYLRALKGSGLKYIAFSCNGFSDAAYVRINGAPLLAAKMEALDAIRAEGLKIILSVLVVQGINEDQIRPLLQYCLEHRDFVEELKLRALARVGKYVPSAKLSARDLIRIVCRELGLREESVLKEHALKKRINELFRRRIFPLRDCSFDFHVRDCGGKIVPVGESLAAAPPATAKFAPLRDMFKAYGSKMVLSGFWKALCRDGRTPWIHDRPLFKISVRSWPEEYSEDCGCNTGYWLDGRLQPFCQALSILRAPEQGGFCVERLRGQEGPLSSAS